MINALHKTIKLDYDISGFRKTGLYPLDKKQMMNEERLAISNCWSVQSDQSSITSSSSSASSSSTASSSSITITSSSSSASSSSTASSSSVTISSNSPSQFVKRRSSLSIASPSTRGVKRRCDLSENVQKYAKIIDEASLNIQKSIIKHLQKQNSAVTPQPRSKVARKYGEVVTEEEVINRREEEEKLKEEKKRQIEERKVENMKKRAQREKIKADKIKVREEKKEKETEKKAVKKVGRRLEESECNVCGILYQDVEEVEKSKWIPCEKCDRWSCPSCLPKGFHVSDDYECEECK